MDFSKNISENIKKLREAQHLTQEQLANSLGISYQAVSKWENAVTTPDVMMLPLIAQFFGVSIDDLFKAKMDPYANEAVRWFAKYESSRNQDDFIRADIEFKKLFESNAYSDDDIRCYGLLYEYHMNYCRDKALEQFDKVISKEKRDEMYYRVCRQKGALLSTIGRGEEEVSRWEERAAEENASMEDYACLINACYWTKQYDKGVNYFEKFTAALQEGTKNDACFVLYATGGDIYRELKKYEEAFSCWQKAINVGSDFLDAWYSMAFCYEELGDYGNAVKVWKRIIDELSARGCTYELNWERGLLRKAESKICDQNKM